MVGCPKTLSVSGKPNAQASFRFGTSAAVMPAAFAGWNRELTRSTPHPFHPARLRSGPAAGQVFDAALVDFTPTSFERNLAIATRCDGVSDEPCTFIAPVSSALIIAVCERFAIASGIGARFSGPGLWQARQFFSNNALPSGAFWAAANPAARSVIRARL